MQKTKKLQPSTIIPREFYVDRGADKQLRDVVANMGRPGYVLVARQMGKTNLLLNAKSELGGSGNVFVYIDLSNVFPDLHQFFRNIIDIAVDSHAEYFSDAYEKIALSRSKPMNRPAHKEHEQELRLLLSAIPGKLVICLDEIDALGKVAYSDSVFSLIRSTYFASRINYPEFTRLTYILSGVVEPNDIIKNKDISPFNIGEKIYLDDFTYDEYLTFVQKAQLPFPRDVVERVFFWTSGNPRMCWDVCSGLEDLLLSSNSITPESVDSVVRKLYLTSYNLAPVDHIRQQVAEDKDVRTAIMNIHLNKSSSVKDAQRTKLYLAGIIRSDFSSDRLVIKNRIIEACLSEAWIRSIEESDVSISDAADMRYGAGDYVGALRLYKEYISKLAPDVSDNLTFFKLGECSFMTGDYKATIDYFDRAVIKRSEAAVLYFRKHLLLAIAQYQLNLTDESIGTFSHIINYPFEDERPIVYYEALINICAPYFKKFKEHSNEILKNCEEIINSQTTINRLRQDGDNVNSLMFAAHHNISYAYEELGEGVKAKEYLRRSMEFASAGGKLSVISELLSGANHEEGLELLAAASSLLSDKSTEFNQNVLRSEVNFSSAIYAALLINAFGFGGESLANELVAPLLQGQYGEHAAWVVISMAANIGISKKDHKLTGWLYNIALNLPEGKLSKDDRKQIYLYLLLLSPEVAPIDIESRYLSEISAQSSEQFDARDARIIYALINKNLDANHMFRAEKLISVVSRIRSQLLVADKGKSESIRRTFLPIDYLELRVLLTRADPVAIRFKAASIESQIAASSTPPQYYTQSFMERVKTDVRFILDQFNAVRPPEKERKYGRNEHVRVIFKNGETREGKFKTFERQWRSGACDII
jgi:tetratricopeptide (TPR) repeat protein